MAAIRRILHATDYSPASRPALRTAIDLAKALRGELVVVHVLSPVVVPVLAGEVYLPPATYDELERSARAAAQRHLDRVAQQAKQAGARVSKRLIEGAPVADRIVRAARALRADLIVMGTHGRTGVTRVVLGSVATRVVATASCPVLTARARSGRA
ncbi:MAG TPA: universal stress protein [Methylomirabilota bacterium]|jgi:universal stress protein A|nr:universal stress protein [Methylomirabilota bacterium]